MKTLPKVSVIIPCYNRGTFIAETIESVLNQSYQNIELVVVDDGCTDNSREVLEQYGERIRILDHPGRVNKGQSAALNLGLESCDGEYIAILDSDDLFAPEKIEVQVNFLQEHTQFGLVYSNGMNINSEGKQTYAIFPPTHRSPVGPAEVLMDCFINLPSNALVRKSVFDIAGGFDESLRAAQDHDMVVRLLEIAPAGYLDKCLWSYRRHEDSISRKGVIARWRNGFKILKAASQRYPYPVRIRLGRRAVLSFRLGQCYWSESNYFRAVPLFIAAGLCDPLRSLKVLIGRERITSPH